MVLKIRLQRFGQKKLPFYHIVCCNARTARNSQPLEKLGTYDPIPKNGVKDITLNFARTKYWLGVGAQPTDTAGMVLERASLYTRPPKPLPNTITKKATPTTIKLNDVLPGTLPPNANDTRRVAPRRR